VRVYFVTTNLRDQFLLDPDVTFLNHGSYGACPKPVFEEYQHWQRELERQPVEFFRSQNPDLLAAARARLARYVNCDVENLIFVQNATTGLNLAIRSLPLREGDEILTTDHEYGSLDMTWEFACAKTGARYIRHPIPLPVTSPEELVDAFWSDVTPGTRVIYLSHITSPTALILPVAEICRRARAAGIMTMIDGAHAPGQVPIDLTELEVDIYSGNCHKWLSAPKGSGFLFARPEHHAWLEPLVICWGWGADAPFADRNRWQGTRDMAAYLSVPAAIDFQERHDWDTVRGRCHALAREARARLTDLTGLRPIAPDSPDWFAQMIAVPLPPSDPLELKRRLYDDYRIEVPIIDWPGQLMVRISFQGYNTADDLDRLIQALVELMPIGDA
jgi:isopenicillin-N epimerase